MNEQNKCKICNLIFKNSRGRNTHIKFKHPEKSIGEYYYEYYPRYCKACKQLISFKGEKYLEKIVCNANCLSEYFKGKPAYNKGERKYQKEYLLNILKELHTKYGGVITQRIVNLDGRLSHQIYHKYFGTFTEACKKAGVPYFSNEQFAFEKIMDTSPLTMITDTREKLPYKFKNFIREKLDVGDYKIKELNINTVVERKELADLKGCLGYNWDRFCREMDRAREKKLYVVILVDASFNDFMTKHHFGKMSNQWLFHQLKSFTCLYGDVCQFLFSGGRRYSRKIVFQLCSFPPEMLIGADLQSIYDEACEAGE